MHFDWLFIRANLFGINSSLRSLKSKTPTPIIVNGKLGIKSIYTVIGNDRSNILVITQQASFNDDIRKNIHAKLIIKNVMVILIVFPQPA